MPEATETQITAEIQRHNIRTMGELTLLQGFVYYDKLGRFRDGEFITTSAIERVEGDLVFTRNSVYRVIN